MWRGLEHILQLLKWWHLSLSLSVSIKISSDKSCGLLQTLVNADYSNFMAYKQFGADQHCCFLAGGCVQFKLKYCVWSKHWLLKNLSPKQSIRQKPFPVTLSTIQVTKVWVNVIYEDFCWKMGHLESSISDNVTCFYK